MIDPTNKAVSKTLQIPPAVLEEILAGNLDALSGVARAQLAYLMENATFRAASPDAPAQLVTGTMEILRKIGVATAADDKSGAGPQVIINITRAREHEAITIEGESTPILENV